MDEMDLLDHLASRKEFLVPLGSIPGASEELIEIPLKEGLIGVERQKSQINIVLLKRGREFIESGKKPWWDCFNAKTKCPDCGSKMKKTGDERKKCKSLPINKSRIYTIRTYYNCPECGKGYVHDRTRPVFDQVVEV